MKYKSVDYEIKSRFYFMYRIKVFIRWLITPVIKALTEIVKWFSGLDATVKKVIMVVLGVIAAIGPLACLISSVATTRIVSAAGSVLANVIAFITSPIALAIAVILWAVVRGGTKNDPYK